MQVLFAHGWREIVEAVAWVSDERVILRVFRPSGASFEIPADCADLSDLWATESIYCAFTPAIVDELSTAFALLGRPTEVLASLPRGDLQASRHPHLRGRPR